MFLEEELGIQDVVGVDEVGRGPLAGPVVACAFYYRGTHEEWLKDLAFFSQIKVTDSKKINAKIRQSILSRLGINKPQLKNIYELKTIEGDGFFVLEECSVEEIDSLNILQASLKAMAQCVSVLETHCQKTTSIWFDGNKVPKVYRDHCHYQVSPVIKGDEKSFAIAIASIIAKEYRDLLMQEYAKDYPHYFFETNAGYPTQAHKDALMKYGATAIHRKTFKGVKELL